MSSEPGAGQGAGFIANLVLLQDAGYFDTSSELKPLLHLWSLGVEEQFYIIWPVLIVVAWRWKNGPLFIACLVLLISFVWNIALTPVNPPAAFFLPVTRFWELMFGCVLALLPLKEPKRSLAENDKNGAWRRFYYQYRPVVHEAASWIGITLILIAVIAVRPNRHFPGWWALLPTLGSVLLIFGGQVASINRSLSYSPLVYVGLISYPLYLWHWPILSYLRHFRFSEPTVLMKLGAICIAFALAHLTYRFIEIPIRFGAAAKFKLIAVPAALGFVGGLGLLIYMLDGIPTRFPPNAQILIRDFVREARINRNELCVVRAFSNPL